MKLTSEQRGKCIPSQSANNEKGGRNRKKKKKLLKQKKNCEQNLLGVA